MPKFDYKNMHSIMSVEVYQFLIAFMKQLHNEKDI